MSAAEMKIEVFHPDSDLVKILEPSSSNTEFTDRRYSRLFSVEERICYCTLYTHHWWVSLSFGDSIYYCWKYSSDPFIARHGRFADLSRA